VQYVASMNPKNGSPVSDRLVHHFATFACSPPDEESLKTIYSCVLETHLRSFDMNVSKHCLNIVNASVELYRRVTSTFLATSTKFHYMFSCTDLSNLFRGICQCTPKQYAHPLKLVRLWLHECYRVFCDRLTSDIDVELFDDVLTV